MQVHHVCTRCHVQQTGIAKACLCAYTRLRWCDALLFCSTVGMQQDTEQTEGKLTKCLARLERQKALATEAQLVQHGFREVQLVGQNRPSCALAVSTSVASPTDTNSFLGQCNMCT